MLPARGIVRAPRRASPASGHRAGRVRPVAVRVDFVVDRAARALGFDVARAVRIARDVFSAFGRGFERRARACAARANLRSSSRVSFVWIKRAAAHARASKVSIAVKLNRRDFVRAVVVFESLRSPRADASDATASGNLASTVAVDGRAYASLREALANARSGSTVTLAAASAHEGTFAANVDGLTIDVADGGRATLSHFTSNPYESVLEIRGRGVVVKNLDVAHGSKSVANNYGVFAVEGSSATFESCAVKSTTGSGFAVEGGEVTLVDCVASGCASHGFVGLGDSTGLPGSGRATLERCTFDGNNANGALIRGGVVVHMRHCTLNGNKRYGVELIDCEGEIESSELRNNAKGSINATNGAETYVVVSNDVSVL